MIDNPIDGIDLSAISPSEFAGLVRNAPKNQIDEVMADATIRSRILGAVFARMGEQYSGNRGTKAVIHWKVLDKPGGGYDHYETVLDGASCTVNTEPEHEPRVTIRLSGTQFLHLASGNNSPTSMFFTGKLKLSGDIGFAAGLTKLFDIPQA